MNLSGSAMPWPGAVRAHSVPGLSTCLEQRRLCVDGSALPISSLEIEALNLAEWAFAHGEVLVLCPPDPLAPLAELIAAAVHIADMIAGHAITGTAIGSSKHVAIVTTDYSARGFYRGLGIRNPKSMSVAPLRTSFAAATLGPDSTIRVLGDDPRNGWSTIFVPSIRALRSIEDIDLVIVDSRVYDPDEIFSLGRAAIVIVGDPSDRFISRIDDRALVFGWDRSDFDRISGEAAIPARLATRIAGSSVEVVAITAHSVCENAALFWQDIGPLTRLGGRSAIASQLAQEAFRLFHDLSALALPIQVYEDLTAPIRVRLDSIEAAARLTRGDARDLYLPMVGAELRDLAHALGPVPPKRDALIRVLREACDDHADVVLVARTAELARFHMADLAEHGLSSVRVVSLGALGDQAPADVAVLTGMAPAWARWVYRSGVATVIRVLGYTPEGEIESVAQGYDEVDLVRRTVSMQSTRESWLARPAAKDRTWSMLAGEPRTVPDDAGFRPDRSPVADVPVTSLTSPDMPPDLWGGDGWFAEVNTGTSEDTGAKREGLGRSGSSVVPAVKVAFEDGRWTLVEAEGTVTRFRPGTGAPDQAYPVSSLSSGDRILLLDGDSQKDLLAKVIEVAEEVPALAVAAGWLSHWRRMLQAAYRRFGSYRAFQEALESEGCLVQTQTVRLWVIGVTIGPEDDEDVRRVGLVMDDPVLRDGHREVCRAIHSLRGAHVRLSKRITDTAIRVGAAAAAGYMEADEVVDERSGLTVADFQESIEILTVEAVEDFGDVPYVLVGRLNQPMQEESGD